MNHERQSILQKLMHKPTLTFNQLWDKQGTSNSFAYHLKVLEEDNLIKKTKIGYKLTHEGKKFAAYLEGASGKPSKMPLVIVLIVVFNKAQDEVLMIKRTKEPFYGIWGFIGGKLNFDQYIFECAADELKQETGLEADLELKGLFSSKTYNNKALSYNHQLFIVKATNPRGKLLSQTREGIVKWIKLSEAPNPPIFPNVPNSIDIALSDHFRWIEADRFQENDKFTEINILKNKNI